MIGVKVGEKYFAVDVERDIVEPRHRVTEIINPGAIPDSMAKYLIRGTRVHQWTEFLDVYGLTVGEAMKSANFTREEYPDLWGYLLGWEKYKRQAMDWFDEVLCEKLLCAEGIPYAGTADRIGILRGQGFRVIDIKTTTQQRPGRSAKHLMQLGTYAHLYRMLHPTENILGGGIVYLRPNADAFVVDYSPKELVSGYEKFQAAWESFKQELNEGEDDGMAESSE